MWCSRWFCNPPPPRLRQCIAYMRSPKGGCCSISDDLFCSYMKILCKFSVNFPIPASRAICKLIIIWNPDRGTSYHRAIARDATLAMLRCYDGDVTMTMLRWRWYDATMAMSRWLWYDDTMTITRCSHRAIAIVTSYHRHRNIVPSPS